MSSWFSLPTEIKSYILCLAGGRYFSVLRFLYEKKVYLVCKEWKSLLEGPYFSRYLSSEIPCKFRGKSPFGRRRTPSSWNTHNSISYFKGYTAFTGRRNKFVITPDNQSFMLKEGDIDFENDYIALSQQTDIWTLNFYHDIEMKEIVGSVHLNDYIGFFYQLWRSAIGLIVIFSGPDYVEGYHLLDTQTYTWKPFPEHVSKKPHNLIKHIKDSYYGIYTKCKSSPEIRTIEFISWENKSFHVISHSKDQKISIFSTSDERCSVDILCFSGIYSGYNCLTGEILWVNKKGWPSSSIIPTLSSNGLLALSFSNRTQIVDLMTGEIIVVFPYEVRGIHFREDLSSYDLWVYE